MVVTLSHIASPTAPLVPIRRSTDNEELLRFLRDDGFAYFGQADRDVEEVLTTALISCARSAGIDPLSVEAVVASSESLRQATDLGVSPSERISMSLSRAGFHSALLYGSSLNSCSNFGAALQIAEGLVRCDRHKRVLLGLADEQARSESRIMKDGAAVMSDLGAACLVSHGPGPGFEIVRVIGHADHGLLTAEEAVAAQSTRLTHAMRALEAKVQRATGRLLREFPLLLVDNLHHAFLEVFADSVDCPVEQFRTPSKARSGHAFAADCLLSLKHMAESDQFEPGQTVALLNIGVATFWFVELRVQ